MAAPVKLPSPALSTHVVARRCQSPTANRDTRPDRLSAGSRGAAERALVGAQPRGRRGAAACKRRAASRRVSNWASPGQTLDRLSQAATRIHASRCLRGRRRKAWGSSLSTRRSSAMAGTAQAHSGASSSLAAAPRPWRRRQPLTKQFHSSAEPTIYRASGLRRHPGPNWTVAQAQTGVPCHLPPRASGECRLNPACSLL